MGNHDRGLVVLLLSVALVALLGLLAGALSGCAPQPRQRAELTVRAPARYWCFAATSRAAGEGLLGCADTWKTCTSARDDAVRMAGGVVEAVGPCRFLEVRPQGRVP